MPTETIMQKNTRGIPTLLALIAALVVLGTVAGCTTLNPATGQQEYDLTKTENVKIILEPFVAQVFVEVMANSPEHKTQIGSYVRAAGNVFKKVANEQAIDPLTLIAEVDRVTAPYQAGLPSLAILAKNTLTRLYKLAYFNRHRAELSPEKWPVHVAGLIATSLDQALKDSGLPGLD
jgi:hypothetical protein